MLLVKDLNVYILKTPEQKDEEIDLRLI